MSHAETFEEYPVGKLVGGIRLDLDRLGKWVTDKREDLDLTQEGLAERVGCKKSHISKIEKARIIDPPLPLISSLARALGVSIIEPLKELGLIKDARLDIPAPLIERVAVLPDHEKDIVLLFVTALWARRFPDIIEGQGGYTSLKGRDKDKGDEENSQDRDGTNDE